MDVPVCSLMSHFIQLVPRYVTKAHEEKLSSRRDCLCRSCLHTNWRWRQLKPFIHIYSFLTAVIKIWSSQSHLCRLKSKEWQEATVSSSPACNNHTVALWCSDTINVSSTDLHDTCTLWKKYRNKPAGELGQKCEKTSLSQWNMSMKCLILCNSFFSFWFCLSLSAPVCYESLCHEPFSAASVKLQRHPGKQTITRTKLNKY